MNRTRGSRPWPSRPAEISHVRAARLSSALAALFPAGGVLGAELHYATTAPGDARAGDALAGDALAGDALLTRPEWRAIRHCRQARIRDFTVGRLCARRALQELGVRGFSLLAAADRRPLWPSGIVGSITHTQGYSAAVVARSDAAAGLGIDTEVIGAVHPRLWPRFCAPQELDWLWRLSPDERARAAALIFAAKEAYFKCQYPLTREPLGFDAVQIEEVDTAAGELAAAGSRAARGGRFRILLRRGQLRARLAGVSTHCARVEGSYRLHGPFITVALALRGPCN